MNIRVGNVPTHTEMIDIAFRRATAAASRIRGLAKQRKRTRSQKSQATEIARISTVQESLEKQVNLLLNGFPQFDELDPFYQDLMLCTVDVDQFRKDLGALGWAVKKVRELCNNTRQKIRKSRDLEAIVTYRKACYGRVASVIKQIRNSLLQLDQVRKAIRSFPSVRTTMPTVVIAGFPNVGKTTILKALTGSAPKIASYPFTTKKLMISYFDDVQIIDTPGLLDRPLRKRNDIERQAILALKHLAKIIVFVFDPSESCGYSFLEQTKLFQEVKKAFKIPIIIVLNKVDLLEPALAKKYKEKFNALLLVAEKEKGIEALRALLDERLGKI